MSTRVAPPSAAALTVFAVLCRNAKRSQTGDGVVEMSRTEIAREAGCTPKAITPMTQRLAANGMLRVERQNFGKGIGNVANRYVIPRSVWRGELDRQATAYFPTPNRSESEPESVGAEA